MVRFCGSDGMCTPAVALLVVGVGIIGVWHAGKVLAASALHDYYSSGCDSHDKMDESSVPPDDNDDDVMSWSYDFLGQNHHSRRK